MVKLPRLLSVLLSSILYVAPVSAGAIRTFTGFPAQSLSKGDDQSSSAVPLGFTLNFQGQTKSAVYVNTNGSITFDGPFDGYPGMPSDNQSGTVIPDLNGTTRSIIAGFFADIDTTDPNLGSITYGATTLSGRPAFVVNFSNVEYYRWYTVGVNNKHNSFQIILIDRSDTGQGNFDIEFNYDQVEWESSDSSGGVNGLGGLSAQIGYSNGTQAPGSFFQLPGSGIPGSFLNGGPLNLISGSKDSGVAGRYVFAIRNGTVPSNAAPTVSSLNPASAQAGSSAFTLIVYGSGFAANSTVLWNGAPLPTSFASSSQLTASVAANLIASQGSATVTTSTNGTPSNGAVFTITAAPNAAPTISSLNPASAQAGSSAFTLTVNGSGFAANSTVLWNGAPLPTSFASASQLTALVAANLIASQGGATVTTSTNGAPSNGLPFTITAAPNAAPTVSSLSPSSAQAGGSAFTLIVYGSGFAANSTVLWNGAPLSTSFANVSQLTASVAANLIASQGSATVTVSTNGTPSNGLPFTITAAPNAAPTISSLNPASAQAGSSAFTLTVNGSGFAANSTVLWNGAPLPTSFASASQLTASVAAGLIASQGSATVTVSTNGTASNGSVFTITAAPNVAPTITSLSPPSAQAGGSAFTLTVTGSGFTANSAILWNGAPLSTSFANASQLTASVAAGLIASQGSATVTVSTNGTASNGSVFTITPQPNAAPTVSSLSPSSAQAGSSAFTLIVYGSGFAANSTVLWNGAPLSTSFANVSQLTASVAANLIASQGSATVTVSTNGTASNSAAFTITGTPDANITISSLSPPSAQAGSPTFILIVNGSGFAANSAILWNGAPLPTSFVSANQLTASITSSLIASQGSATVTVSTNGAVSNSSAFTITAAPNVAPTISSLTPASAQSGSPAFTLIVNGSGFTANSAISWNGTSLPTSFVSANQLTTFVTSSLIASQGSATVTVSTNGTASNGSAFTITAASAALTISSLSPASAQAGGPAFTLTVNGSGFTSSSAVVWNNASLPTSFVSANQLTASVAANLIVSQGGATVRVTKNGVASSGVAFIIAANSAPIISSLNPASAQAGGPAFTLTVNGSGFAANSTVLWNGTPALTSFVSDSQLTASIAANLIASEGIATVTIGTGGTPSNALSFTITPAAAVPPALTSLSPPSALAGGPGFTLTVNGSGFKAAGAAVLWNGSPVPTTFVNATQLTAVITANLLTQQGDASVSATFDVQATNSLPFPIVGGTGSQLSIFPTEVNFTATAGGPSPAPANISIWSNGVPARFHVTASAGTWLDTNMRAGQTNQGFSVTSNIAGVGAGGYRGDLTIASDTTPTDVRRIPVTLTVTPAADPQLEVAPLNQAIEMPLNGQPVQYNLIVTNPGGGKLSFIAQTLGGDWLTLQNTYGAATVVTPSAVNYTVDPSGLNAGIYNAEIIVTDINSTQRLNAQITLIVSEKRPAVVVSQEGLEFAVTSQQPPASKSFSIRNGSDEPVVLSVEAEAPNDGAVWLDTAPHLSSVTLPPGAITKLNVLVNPQSLTPSRYVGFIRVRAGSAGKIVQSIPVLLNVQESSASFARLTQAGVTVTGIAGALSSSTATIGLFNPTAKPIIFSSVPSAEWLSLKPATSSIAPFQTLTVEVAANFAKVADGIRSDVIRIPFSDGIVSTLNVQSVASSGPVSAASQTAPCTPSKLAVQLTSLEQGFTLTAGGIVTIQAKVFDNCGNARPSSTVIARINSEPNPLVLSSEDQGVWASSWSPKNPRAGVRVVVAAASNERGSILTGQTAVTGTVNATSSVATAPTRVVNAAGFQTDQVSPGSWISIFGNELASAQVVASSKPYPTELGGTRVTLGGIPLPLLFVDPNQLNVFIPFELTPNTLQQLIIERRSAFSIPINIKIADAGPGIYAVDPAGLGQGAVMISGTGTMAAPAPVGRPARRGELLEISSSGLGLVTNRPQDGQIASIIDRSPTVNPVAVTIGGVNTRALFAGLAPGCIGLYQINVQVPDDAPSGSSVPLSISVAGKESNTVTIAVE